MRPLLGFAAAAIAVTGALLIAGLVLTRSSSAATREAILWACGVAFVGAIAGLLPLVLGAVAAQGAQRAGPGAGPAAVSRFLASMLLRMAATAAGSAAVIVLANVPAKPFLLWLAVGYLALLVVETAFALRVFRSL